MGFVHRRVPNLNLRLCWAEKLGLGLLLLLLLAGCQQQAGEDYPPPAPARPTPASTPSAGGEVGEAPSAGRQLVVWLPPFTGVLLGDQADAVLDEAFFQFEQAHPGVNVDVHLKAEFGAAAMPAFLRSAQQVAPSVLPDLVLVRTQQLWQLVDLGLVQPLSADETPAFDDYFAFAADAVVYRDEVHGIPFAVDVLTMAYDPDELAQAPRTLDDLAALDAMLWFAAGGAETSINLPVLLQYVGGGGELREDGTLTADDGLAAWFALLESATAQGRIARADLDLSLSEQVWRVYVDQPDGLAFVLAGDGYGQPAFIADRALAAVPTLNGEVVSVGPTWAFAILATDAEQRRLAANLVATLMTPEIQGAWSRLAHRPPSRRAALAMWTTAGADIALLETLLESAVSLPNGRPFSEFARRLQSAQLALLRGELTANEALLRVRGE